VPRPDDGRVTKGSPKAAPSRRMNLAPVRVEHAHGDGGTVTCGMKRAAGFPLFPGDPAARLSCWTVVARLPIFSLPRVYPRVYELPLL
jgi:hypothetical protein